jgi:putative NIF3 family GTP cyclohydrolase 1 type 2
VNTNDIREYLISHSPWVDCGHTVDQVLAGDACKEVHTVAVGWFPAIDNLRAAHGLGCDLFVSHEPLFWDHWATGHFKGQEPALTKQRLLDESGMVVLRAHDTWDNWPGIGIRDSWAQGLGLTHFLAEDETRWHAVYQIEETTLKEFAAYVASKIAILGEDSVRVLGDPERRVSRPSLGVGCLGPDKDMVDAGSDVLIVCDDGAAYWRTRERLVELGAAVIVVEHGTSEMWGIENLARHLAETFPELEVHYLDRHPKPWTVMG